jgi:hypothetical protein
VVFEAGFVGSKGTHLGEDYNLNQPYYSLQAYQQTGTFASPDPQLSTISYLDFRTNSIYNAGQFTLRKSSARGLLLTDQLRLQQIHRHCFAVQRVFFDDGFRGSAGYCEFQPGPGPFGF